MNLLFLLSACCFGAPSHYPTLLNVLSRYLYFCFLDTQHWNRGTPSSLYCVLICVAKVVDHKFSILTATFPVPSNFFSLVPWPSVRQNRDVSQDPSNIQIVWITSFFSPFFSEEPVRQWQFWMDAWRLGWVRWEWRKLKSNSGESVC